MLHVLIDVFFGGVIVNFTKLSACESGVEPFSNITYLHIFALGFPDSDFEKIFSFVSQSSCTIYIWFAKDDQHLQCVLASKIVLFSK